MVGFLSILKKVLSIVYYIINWNHLISKVDYEGYLYNWLWNYYSQTNAILKYIFVV